VNTTLLIIDDDNKLNRLLARYLEGFGFNLLAATHPEKGMELLKQKVPDLVILDVMLPDTNGFEVCKRIRSSSTVPIIMLTARGDLMDKVVGLELGADDYLPKPFEPRELVARIQSVLRSTRQAPDNRLLERGRLTIDLGRRQAMIDGAQIALTTNEFNALSLLASHPGRVLDRDEILQELRGMDSEAFNRTVDITISRLRQKLGDDPRAPRFIKTVWGAGYVFVGGDAQDA
jgi:DNA-binding response OmpR family regulator